MDRRVLGLLAFFVLPGVFVYLVGVFLISTFDINLWYDGQRFTAVVVYIYILVNLARGLYGDSDKKKNQNSDKVPEKVEAEEVEQKQEANEV